MTYQETKEVTKEIMNLSYDTSSRIILDVDLMDAQVMLTLLLEAQLKSVHLGLLAYGLFMKCSSLKELEDRLKTFPIYPFTKALVIQVYKTKRK